MRDTNIDTGTETPKRFQCRHIFTDGHRCGSACLRNEEFCYYHHTTRKPVANPRQRQSRRAAFDLPLPDPNDRFGIQASIGAVLQRIASNEIDPRRAGLLLYGLQIASLNLPKPQREAAPETVEDITTDPELGTLAPRAEMDSPTQRPSAVGRLLMKIMQNDEAARAAQEKTILPTLNAEAESCVPTHCNHAAPRTRRKKPHPQAKPNRPSAASFALVLRPTSQPPNHQRAEGPRHPSLGQRPRSQTPDHQRAEGPR